jgi:hypothetical protein
LSLRSVLPCSMSCSSDIFASSARASSSVFIYGCRFVAASPRSVTATAWKTKSGVIVFHSPE